MQFPRNLILLLMLGALVHSCSPSRSISGVSGKIVSVDSTALVAEDSAALQIIKPYRDSMQLMMSEKLAETTGPFTKGTPESTLGNFVSDLALESANEYCTLHSLPLPDFCLLNNGGFRSPLPQGDLLLRHAFELMPFDNELVIVTLSGDSVVSLLNYIASKKGAPVSNLKMEIGQGEWRDVTIAGITFRRDQEYRVLTSDYLAGGGDGCLFFRSNSGIVRTHILVRNAIITKMRSMHLQGKKLTPQLDGRIKVY